MPKFSEGPWKTYRDRDNEIGVYMVDADGSCGPQVCKVLVENLDRETDDEAQAVADADLIAAGPQLLESLDNVTAALETVLLGFRKQMHKGDWDQRAKLANDARALVDSLMRSDSEGGVE